MSGRERGESHSEIIDRMLEWHEGRVELPDEYVEADRLVIRTPWFTQVRQGRTLQYYASENEHLAVGEVELKRFDGPPEIYEVDLPEDVREGLEENGGTGL